MWWFEEFMCVNAWPTGSGTTRSYDLVEVGVALLEEMGFEVLKLGFGQCDTVPFCCLRIKM